MLGENKMETIRGNNLGFNRPPKHQNLSIINCSQPRRYVMAWYGSHRVRYRGRLLVVTSRYGCFMDAVVAKGQPLNLEEDSRDWKRLKKLFDRSERIQREVAEQSSYDDY